MHAIQEVLEWLRGKAIVFAALVCALLIYQATKPSFEGLSELRRNAGALAAGEKELAAAAAEAINTSDSRLKTLDGLGRERIDFRLETAKRAREPLVDACGSDLNALLANGAAGVIHNRRQCLRATLLTREIETLTAVRGSLDARLPGETLPKALKRHASVLHQSAATYRDAGAKLAALDRDYVPAFLQRQAIQKQQARLTQAQMEADAAQRDARALILTRRAIARASRSATESLAQAQRSYRALIEERGGALSKNVGQRAAAWAETNNLAGVLKAAAMALILIMATPFIVRLICYFVLAPVAMRRGKVRFFTPGSTESIIPPTGRSTTSVGLRLAEGEELLVRQDYLQTTSDVGMKCTQWFLDWRHPFTSAISGLLFLTRIRGDGEQTTISAVRDPFAEVIVLSLPEGTACILQPRALAAVAQPSDRPLRVTTHWRLSSLTAWLTMQLRYVVFHGPTRLVLKGGRGVRIERAQHGRIFGQDQLVGFSTDLSYSVTRTETFWPYFLGREQLLKDRVEAGVGVLIVEEAPFAGRRASGVPHGIEGLMDAALKVFGM